MMPGPSMPFRKIGKAVTGDADSYQYLVESIRKFPRQSDFADMIRKGGL